MTGSREWPRDRAVEVRDAIVREVTDVDPLGVCDVTIVHGACEDPKTKKLRGADAWADLTAVQMGYAAERHPAKWREFGKPAGMRRNREMVALGADVVLAFPLGASAGTRGCIREAQRAGIPVQVFEG